MKYYKLKNKKAPWADYGRILISGMTGHLDREGDLLQLERTGPFVPPLINTGGEDVIVTDEIKRKLSSSGLTGISFKPVIKKHIVFIEWTNWDFSTDEPLFYPEGGEPEDYILDNPHSEELAEQMGPIWEIVIPETGIFDDRDQYIPGTIALDICMAENRGYILVSEKAKVWIEQYAGDWVTFSD